MSNNTIEHNNILSNTLMEQSNTLMEQSNTLMEQSNTWGDTVATIILTKTVFVS